MASAFSDLQNGVVLAELAGYGDGPYCAKHGAGGALVVLGSYIVDAGDDVDYPSHFVFKPPRDNYADYLKEHVSQARNCGGKVAVSVCSVKLSDNVDFLQATVDAGADYVSYCAHSVMEMFVSRNLSSKFCCREHYGTLRTWAATLAQAVSVPVIFKIGAHILDEQTIEAVEIMSESGIPIVNINIHNTSPSSPGLEMVSALKGKCQFLIAGGGIKDVEGARRVLSAGADAVAIGTAAMRDPLLIGNIQNSLRS